MANIKAFCTIAFVVVATFAAVDAYPREEGLLGSVARFAWKLSTRFLPWPQCTSKPPAAAMEDTFDENDDFDMSHEDQGLQGHLDGKSGAKTVETEKQTHKPAAPAVSAAEPASSTSAPVAGSSSVVASEPTSSASPTTKPEAGSSSVVASEPTSSASPTTKSEAHAEAAEAAELPARR